MSLKAAAAFMLVVCLSGSQSPPAGRPPVAPLERYDSRVYDVSIEVAVRTEITPEMKRRFPHAIRVNFNLTDAQIFMPVILQSDFSTVERDSITASLWAYNQEAPGIHEKMRLEDGQPFGSHRLSIPIERMESDRFRWRAAFRTQVWSSRIDDAAAGRVEWPGAWPRTVRDGLRPQRYIESDDPIFSEMIDRITGGPGRVRNAPPYYAAKEIVRFALQNMQVEGTDEHRGMLRVLIGLNINGAKHAAHNGRGTSHDLVAFCVALLRAADIPARPVIGIHRENELNIPRRGTLRFVSWAEFYLPETGWVPFDPVAMRGKGLHRDVREPWPDFGTMRNLNMRIPLAYHFTPPGALESPEYPAIWGWDPNGPLPTDNRQEINFSIAHHDGRGEE